VVSITGKLQLTSRRPNEFRSNLISGKKTEMGMTENWNYFFVKIHVEYRMVVPKFQFSETYFLSRVSTPMLMRDIDIGIASIDISK